MAVTPRFFGPTGSFLIEATGQMIGFVREPGRFKLLDYVQVVKSEEENKKGKPVAAYAILDPDAAVRTGPRTGPTVTGAPPDIQGLGGPSVDAKWRWQDGEDRPKAQIKSNFKWQVVEMERRNYGYEYGEQTVDSADLPIMNIERMNATSVAMTVKTDRVIQMLQTAANWPAANVADANVLNGGRGKWNEASSDEQSGAFAAIRLAVARATINIVQATNTAVRPEDLRIIISPNAAYQVGSTGEIYNYVKSSQFSQARQEGKNQLNEQYLMPKYYAGVEWIIEDSTIVTDEMNAAGTPATIGRSFIKNDTTAIMVSRKGGLDGVYGSESFSTVQLFYYRYEMAVEEKHDSWNKKHLGAVVDQYAEVLAASRAGFLIQNII